MTVKVWNEVCFIGDVECLTTRQIINVALEYDECKTVMCITAEDQSNTYNLMEYLGFEAVGTFSKFNLPEQRELDSGSLTLWSISRGKLKTRNEKPLKEIISEVLDKPEYEMLNWSREEIDEKTKEIPIESSSYNIRVPEEYFSTATFPLVKPKYSASVEEYIQTVKNVHTEHFGYVIPPMNPFTGKRIYSYSHALKFHYELQKGEHL